MPPVDLAAHTYKHLVSGIYIMPFTSILKQPKETAAKESWCKRDFCRGEPAHLLCTKLHFYLDCQGWLMGLWVDFLGWVGHSLSVALYRSQSTLFNLGWTGQWSMLSTCSLYWTTLTDTQCLTTTVWRWRLLKTGRQRLQWRSAPCRNIRLAGVHRASTLGTVT